MIARRTRRLALAALAVLAVASACTRDVAKPAAREFELGPHRLQATVPMGWEALDQGQQKRFRKGEFEIVLRNLGSRTPPARDLDEFVDWGLAAMGIQVGPDQRHEVKSRRPMTIDGREAMDIETWNRLDHTNPQRFSFIRDYDDLLALHTVGMAFEDSLNAFGAIRDSLHFVSARR